jgi:uncharacterized protein
MACALFRFYAELNDFLSQERRYHQFEHYFRGRVSIKDMVESLGIPHTEIDLILVNGVSVGFTYIVQDGDSISAYPVFESLDIGPILRIRAQPLRITRFVLDTHLGRLTAYLRMLGFDSRYQNDFTDDELACISSQEKRILLTRDRGLLKRSVVTHGYCVRSIRPRLQVVEVVRRFDLIGSFRPFTRCLVCNETVELVNKDEILDQLPPSIRLILDDFRRCPCCLKVYWKGSHYQRMRQLIEEACGKNGPAGS